MIGGCASGTVGATAADLGRARAIAPDGDRLFAEQCARCHGKRGEGIPGVPAILGAGTLPEYPREQPPSGVPGVYDPQQMQVDSQTHRIGPPVRDPFRSAQDLYVYLLGHLPAVRAKKALSPEACWPVVAFMLAAHGSELPQEGIGPSNASSIPIPRRAQ